ncbi:MAG: DUF5652 family protein [Patescibacteria group bacterium]
MIDQLLAQNIWLLVILIITIPIKGVALWKSARISQKWWFIVLLISSTFGILDLIYILFVAKKYTVESKEIS